VRGCRHLPRIVAHLLSSATGQYPNKWSVHDIGSSYPVANGIWLRHFRSDRVLFILTGHNDGKDEAMQVEEVAMLYAVVCPRYRLTALVIERQHAHHGP
jgi:hypothetical protein